MNLMEIFTFNAPGEWEQDGSLHTKRFSVSGENYELRVRVDEIENEEYVNVTFSWVSPENETTMNLTNMNKSTAQVVATVYHSVWDRFSDKMAFIFSAKDSIKREQFYAKLASYLAMQKNLKHQSAIVPGGKVFALLKQNSKLELKDFV